MSNFLDSAVEYARNLVVKQSPSVLGIDISSSSIKVVQLRKKSGKAVLETYGEISLGPYAETEVGRATNLPTEKIIEALKDVMREAKVTTKNCGISIPLSSSLISIIEMPFTDEKQLKTSIPIEARKYIPVPISEVMLDWKIIPRPEVPDESEAEKKKRKKTEILLVAIHKEVINAYQDIVQKTELQASFFEIELFSTIRSSLEHGITPVLLFDFGVSTTKLYIVEHGIVRESHIINKGSQDITIAVSQSLDMGIDQAEEFKRLYGLTDAPDGKNIRENAHIILDFVFSEAQRVMLNFEKKQNKPVSKVVFAGGGSLLKGLLERSRDYFNAEIELADPFSKTETPAFLENVLSNAGPEFAVAVGIALRKLEELP